VFKDDFHLNTRSCVKVFLVDFLINFCLPDMFQFQLCNLSRDSSLVETVFTRTRENLSSNPTCGTVFLDDKTFTQKCLI
jgi:hypothetical protein